MLYVGLDIHSKRIAICALDEKGQVVHRSQVRGIEEMLRALLRGAGVVPPRQPGLWTKKGLAWLRQLGLPTASQQLRRDLLLQEVEALHGQVRRLEQELNRRAQQTPAVARRRPPAEHPRGGHPHGRGGGRVHRRPAAVPPRQGGRPVLRSGAVPGPVG